MNDEQQTLRQHIEQRLGEAQELIEKGIFADAIGRVRDAKLVDVRNIYLIALEKQLEKVLEESKIAPPVPERVAEVTKSLSGIIQHAIKDAAQRDRPLSVPSTPAADAGGVSAAETEKKKALEKLKSQYFERVDEYVAKGDYPRALEEVRRIKILDPSDRAAKEFEEKIAQLSTVAAEKAEAAKEKAEAAPKPDEKPQRVAEPPPIRKSEARKGSGIKIAAIVVVLAVAVGTLYLVTQKEPEPSPQSAVIAQRSPIQPTAAATTIDTSNRQSLPVESPPAEEDNRARDTRVSTDRVSQPTREQPRETRMPAAEPPARDTRNQRSQPTTQQTQSAEEPSARPATTDRSTDQPPTTIAPAPPAVVTTPVVTPPAQPATEPAAAAGATGFLPIEVEPKVLSLQTPEYPQIAMRMNISGNVIVRVLVDAAGNPKSAAIHRSDHEILNNAAIDAAMKSKYSPGRTSQGPAEAHILVRFTFSLRR